MISAEKTSDKRVSVQAVTKKIRNNVLLSGISFDVHKGECFGVLGENGSGKTMLLRTITGLVSPTSGGVSIMGKCPRTEPEEAIGAMGALIGVPAFYDHISAYDNLRLFADGSEVPGSEQIISALKGVGLDEERNKKVGAFSRGMLQRLGLALALMGDSPVRILDEPTQGLDDIWTKEIGDIIRARVEKGETFILTSHDFDFVMELCSRVLILDAGEVVYTGPLNELAEFPYYFYLRCSPENRGRDVMEKLEYVHKIIESNGAFELTLHQESAPELVKSLIDSGCKVHECALRHYSVSGLVAKRRSGK